MNSLDTSIQIFLTHAAVRSELFNHAIRTIAEFYLFRGVLPLAILYAIWFNPGVREQWRREMVVATIFSGLLALFFGRILAHYLPFRVRPVYDLGSHLTFPLAGTSEAVLRTWSSFPSDHAMLWASIAMGIFLACRWAGLVAFLHFAIFICLPRVYLGLHSGGTARDSCYLCHDPRESQGAVRTNTRTANGRISSRFLRLRICALLRTCDYVRRAAAACTIAFKRLVR
jgi:undecaprenyl-diphosphatase